MTLKTCLEIGMDCGLSKVSECIYNIELHAMSIFSYDNIESELKELQLDVNNIFQKTNFTNDTEANILLDWLNMEDDGINTEDLNL